VKERKEKIDKRKEGEEEREVNERGKGDATREGGGRVKTKRRIERGRRHARNKDGKER